MEYNNYFEGVVFIIYDNGIVFGGDKGFYFFYFDLLIEILINIFELFLSVLSLFLLKVFGKE